MRLSKLWPYCAGLSQAGVLDGFEPPPPLPVFCIPVNPMSTRGGVNYAQYYKPPPPSDFQILLRLYCESSSSFVHTNTMSWLNCLDSLSIYSVYIQSHYKEVPRWGVSKRARHNWKCFFSNANRPKSSANLNSCSIKIYHRGTSL